MPTAARTFGFELEFSGGAYSVQRQLYNDGYVSSDEQHPYHCDCAECDPNSEWALRVQRDSTADGEFITRILSDWDDLQDIAAALCCSARDAGALMGNRVGLHVHVGNELVAQPGERRMINNFEDVPRAYLAYERYFTEIVAPGNSIRKREMNSTLMEAARQYVADYTGGGGEAMWMHQNRAAVISLLRDTISRDRHVDLNWCGRQSTWEFRCFNSTNAEWRIELACRMAVAFVHAAPELNAEVERVVRGSSFWPEGCDSIWGEIIRPAYSELPAPHPTKKPVVPMARFIEIMSEVDPDLRPLIERQANYMLARFAKTVEHAA